MTPPLARLHAIVIGIVQGVSFRWATVDRAEALNLTGWVRNRADGSVEVIAEGPKAALEQLLGFLHHGPPGAVVREVQVDWPPATGEFQHFEIRR
jgi:acylphosphatase